MPAPYIPAKDADAINWGNNFATLLTANPTAYGEDAPTALVVQNAFDAFDAAYQQAIDPSTRTPATVSDKDAQRVNFEATVRPVAQRINARDSVTNEQRSSLGITVRKTTRTPVPAPATKPVFSIRNQQQGVLEFQVRDETTPTSKAKPFGVIGVDVHVFVGDQPPAELEDYPLNKTTGKTPNTLAFDLAQSGETARVACRWTTRSGPGGVAQKGPWSDVTTFVVM